MKDCKWRLFPITNWLFWYLQFQSNTKFFLSCLWLLLVISALQKLISWVTQMICSNSRQDWPIRCNFFKKTYIKYRTNGYWLGSFTVYLSYALCLHNVNEIYLPLLWDNCCLKCFDFFQYYTCFGIILSNPTTMY